MSAIISPCGKFRYRLTRGEGRRLGFVMLNPSTADAELDDPTIRRCIGFAKREGYGGIVVGNLYAYRATKPADLAAAGWQHGPDNAEHLEILAGECERVVCAWGANAPQGRVAAVVADLLTYGADLVCLSRTKAGAPRHPLYVLGDQPFERFP